MDGSKFNDHLMKDRRTLESYLRFSYVLGTPETCGGKSIFGSEIRFSCNRDRGREEYLNELNRILDEVLKEERKHSDAAFLSSGVDSSLIAFGIQAKKTFSVAYEEEDFDESPLSLAAADRLGSEHRVVKIRPEDYFDAVGEAMANRDTPTGDASYIALYIAAKETARYTDAVCSGEGPDEMFCGYPCYSKYFDDPREDFWLDVNSVMDIGEVQVLPRYGGDGFLKMNAFDLTKWMHGNILPNVYAAAKGTGVEIRTPYMSPELLDLALSLPVRYKADRKMGKLLFRESARRYVGDEIAFREKRGFPVPVRKWMRREPFKTQILDALTGSVAREVLAGANAEGVLNAFYAGGDNSVWKQIWEMFALIRWLEVRGSER